MESPYRASIQKNDSSRPSIGFPLGTALLLIIIFTLSGVFSCCYHWEKLRSIRRLFSRDADNDTNSDGALSKSKFAHRGSMFEKYQSLPVIMPGDKMAKFIALPCPCRPPRVENIILHLPKPHNPPLSPPIAVPLY